MRNNNPTLWLLMLTITIVVANASNTNWAYQPCTDTKIKKSDSFTLGIAFSSRDSFYYKQSHQLSPCDTRLSLSSPNSQLSVFRPKIDEISLLTIKTSTFSPVEGVEGIYSKLKIKGRKYAARSPPAFVASSTYTVTSFTLVLEFQKGRLQDLYWKRDGCASCSGNSNFVCLNKQDCAIKTSSCKNQGGSVDSSLGIQLAFSGTDKHFALLNSWYEVENLRQYSLYDMYSNLRDSLTTQYNNFFK